MENKTIQQLAEENENLRLRLQEAEDTLSAIRGGEVDALVVQGPKGEQAFTLTGKDQIYRLLVQTMHEAGIMATPEGQILYCNNRFSEMLHYPIEEIIGKSIEDFVHKTSHKDMWTLLVGAQVKPMRKRIVFTASDGSLVPARISANIFTQDNVSNICMVAADLTEIETSEEIIKQINEQKEALRVSHQKYQHLVEGSSSIIIIYDKDLNIDFINEFGTRFLGFEPDELIGKNAIDRIIPSHDSSGGNILKQLEDFKNNPDNYLNNIHQTLRKDGSLVWITWANKPIYDKDGQLQEIVAVGNDVSKLKEAEENLKTAQKELERSNKDLEQFAYIVSHDLREPLRAITGFIQLLLQRYAEKLDGKGFEYIQSALDGAKRLNELLTGFLNYSKVNVSSQPAVPVPVESALKNAMASLEKSIIETKATIIYDSLPTIKISGTQLIQLFLNLLNNAIKYRNEAPPKIHIGCNRNGKNSWLFSVSDNGIGIDKQHFERIFMVFQRTHNEDRFPGNGIGLSICKKIVERNGGKIWVESEPGKGSTFYFTLPCID
jgi:PAS domain S-box-containing protein